MKTENKDEKVSNKMKTSKRPAVSNLTEGMELKISISGKRLPKFRCVQCGQCCQSLSIPITFQEAKALEKSTSFQLDKKTSLETPAHYYTTLPKQDNGECYFLKANSLQDNRTCEVYEFRPFSCQLFPYKFKIGSNNDIKLGVHTAAEFFCKGLKKEDSINIERIHAVKDPNQLIKLAYLQQLVLKIVNEVLVYSADVLKTDREK